MICPGCGASVTDSHRFCSACGQALTQASAAPAPAPASESEPRAPERKPVTILFADLCHSTRTIAELDPEDAMLRLDPAIRLMRDAVLRFGGIVNREQGDGVMAMFGVPVAREGHAVSACLAARAILDAAALADLPVRVGLASGDVVVRPTGRDATDYDAVGIAAHLAARMEHLAEPGTALATERTVRLSRGCADFAPLGPVLVRGLNAPIPVFRLLAAADRPAWEVRSGAYALTRLRGRERELATLAGLAGEVGEGGRVVVITAEAGMGKSRLAHEFLAAHGAGWRVLRASATEQAQGTPYNIAATLFRALLGDGALADGHATLDLPALRAILGDNTDEAGGNWAAADPAARRRRMLAALAPVVLLAASRQPTIVLVEDLHWVDPSSNAALDILAARAGEAPMLLIATSRPGGLPGWATGTGPGVTLALPPLAEASAAAMLEELLGDHALQRPLRAKIVARAEGTPFFIEEIARSLRDAESDALVEVPDTVHAILAARIDRLPPQRRRVLQVAAVLGRRFAPTLLSAILGLPMPLLQAELAELDAADLLRPVATESCGTDFTFCHALTHAEAYEGQLHGPRRWLHGQVFSAMRSSAPAETDAVLQRLAGHALRAELWAEAAEYAHRAGGRANARYAWREAIGFLEDALKALANLPRERAAALASETWLQLRVAAVATGDVRRMLACLDEARRLAPESGDALVVAQIDVRRCMGLTKLGQMEHAIPIGRAALAAVQALDVPQARVTASFALGEALFYAGDYSEAELVLRADLELARGEALSGVAPGPGTPAVLYLSCLSRVLTITGQYDAAQSFAEEACGTADRLRRPFDQAESRQALGLLHLARGSTVKALVVLEEALALVGDHDSSLLLPIVAAVLGPARLRAGRPAQAKSLLEQAIAQAEREGLAPYSIQCALALAEFFATDEPARARAMWADAHRRARLLGLRALDIHGGRGADDRDPPFPVQT